MSITIGNDTNNTIMDNDLVGLYYYLLDFATMKDNGGANASVTGFVPTIQSISYNPFFEINSNYLTVRKCPFDEKHFGKPSGSSKADVYRLLNFPTHWKTLAQIDIRKEIWDKLDEEYETRLLMYPFKYFLLTDYLNPPLMLKPELMNVGGQVNIRVTIGISSISKYNLYVDDYKEDSEGNIEGMVNNNPLQFPVGSSAYSSFLATSGQTFAQTNNNALLENDISLKQNMNRTDLNQDKAILGGITGMIGNLFSKNPLGALSTGVNTGFDIRSNNMQRDIDKQNYAFKEYNIESMALARKNDMLNTPRTMKTLGNDSKFTMDLAKRKVELIEYGLTSQYETKISKYFKRYGYKVNRIGFPVLDSRRYYNFIKFSNCSIYGAKVPKETIEEIQEIFESGVTIWHVDNGVRVKDYSVNNKEV